MYVHYFYNQQWQVLETRDTTTESDQPESLQPDYQYLWSPRYIDAPVLRDENTDADGLCDDERIYYLGDANFNVTTLVDTGGDAVERYLYAPYGDVAIYDGSWSSMRSASSYGNAVRYTGREWEGETGILHYRRRYYHVSLGRFVLSDLINYAETLNLYTYTQNAPTTRSDPTGLFSLPMPIDKLPVPPAIPTREGTYPASCYRCPMQCGPEVGPNLLLTLIRARAVIRSQSMARRIAAHRQVAVWPKVLTGWDIGGLVNLEVGKGVPWQPCGKSRKGTICDPCVQVFGAMHDVWEINYALWGIFTESVYMSLDQAKKYAGYYKYVFKWEASPCKPKLQYTTTLVEWLSVGYEFGKRGPMGVVFSSLVPKKGNPRFRKCDICGVSIPLRRFTYTLPIFGREGGLY
jgi:RHS repeat-associated protein